MTTDSLWEQSLAGAAGNALWHIAQAQSGAGSWETAHQAVRAMTRRPVVAHPTAGLYRGAPAVAFVLATASLDAYAPALATLDRHITALTRHRLEAAHRRIDRAELPELREYDLISGLTGIGAYLLHRHHGGDLLVEVLAYLVRLTEPVKTAEGEELPGWWTSSAPNGKPSPTWAGGHGNFGVAHGIGGPLALLSAAMRRGVTVPGHVEAIGRVCAWLDWYRRDHWWPGTISRSEWRMGTTRQAGPDRPSWCYGTPGLARAQQLAGLATGDPARRRLAEDAMTACLTDPRQLSQLTDHSLCHGWAGLLQITRRMAADAAPGSPLAGRLPYLRARLESRPLSVGEPADDGLLEGKAGIRLARHTAPTAAHWDACLLLDG